MLASEQTNSSPVKNNSAFMETVQDKLKDIKNFSNWSAKEQMIAVGAVGVMVGALLPFVAVALPVAATGAIVALTLFFAVKAVEYTFKGLKWSAEKTVDGAKYTAGKVKDASVYTAEKAREGYHSVKGAVSSVGKATKKGTGTVLGKMGRSLSNLSESMSSLDEIPDLMGPQKSQGKAVLLAKRELDPDLTNNGRDSGNPSLRSNSLSRSSSTDSIRTDSTISSKAELLNPAKHKEVKTTAPFKVPLWLGGKKAPEETTNVKYQVLSESDTLSRQVGESTFYVAPPKPPRSNSLNSIGTVSTATVSSSGSKDFVTVNPNRLSRSSSFSGYDSPKLTPVDPPKLSRSSSTDSGFNSSTSSPAHTMFTNEGGKVKTQADLKETGHLNKLVGQPSTYKSEVYIEPQQPGVISGK